MKKIFISQPMRGFSDEQILKKRKEISNLIKNKIGEEVEIIDSFLKDFKPEGNVPVKFLGKSIGLLSQADIAFFGEGWDEARGCKIEHEIAVQYNINIIDYREFL